MLRPIILSALLAGLIAGLLSAGLQAAKVTPLILEAERYEAAAPGAAEADEPWAPADGLERAAYTVLSNVLAGIGFGLVITAGFALRGAVDWRRGVLWGLGGFAAVNLAPALGLPPEVPGMAGAELAARQTWWLLTVALTGGGLALLAFAPRLAWKAAGVALVVAPHVIGAPHVAAEASAVPAELAAAFVATTLVVNGLFWLVLGGSAGYFFHRFARA